MLQMPAKVGSKLREGLERAVIHSEKIADDLEVGGDISADAEAIVNIIADLLAASQEFPTTERTLLVDKLHIIHVYSRLLYLSTVS
jgi:hypothetical protein